MSAVDRARRLIEDLWSDTFYADSEEIAQALAGGGLLVTDPDELSTADRVRSYICELGDGDHCHADCWYLSTAADIIEARDDYARREVAS